MRLRWTRRSGNRIRNAHGTDTHTIDKNSRFCCGQSLWTSTSNGKVYPLSMGDESVRGRADSFLGFESLLCFGSRGCGVGLMLRGQKGDLRVFQNANLK